MVLLSHYKSLSVVDKAVNFVENSVSLEEKLGKIGHVGKAIHSVLQ